MLQQDIRYPEDNNHRKDSYIRDNDYYYKKERTSM